MKIRKMEKGDLEKGFLESLKNLSTVGDLPIEEWHIICDEILQNPVYTIFVAEEEEGKIVGTATFLLERKFIHKGGFVGHIENVAVQKENQGQGIGGKLVAHAISYAKEKDCYKVILDCSDHNVPFYEKFGFKKAEICMRLDL